jgi:hypothetical protein
VVAAPAGVVPDHPQADLFVVFSLAAASAGVFLWLARFLGRTRRGWFGYGLVGGLLLGCMAWAVGLIAILVRSFVAIKRRPLTPLEAEAVEVVPGWGQSWYLRERRYLALRAFGVMMFFLVLVVGVGFWVALAQQLAFPERHGLLTDLLPAPPPDPMSFVEAMGILMAGAWINLISGVYMWRQLYRRRKPPLVNPESPEVPARQRVLSSLVRNPAFRLLSWLLLPAMAGPAGVLLWWSCQRELSTERIWRKRTELRMKRLQRRVDAPSAALGGS